LFKIFDRQNFGRLDRAANQQAEKNTCNCRKTIRFHFHNFAPFNFFSIQTQFEKTLGCSISLSTRFPFLLSWVAYMFIQKPLRVPWQLRGKKQQKKQLQKK